MDQLHFGVLPISPDEAGNYSFELHVTDPEGNLGKASVTVRSNPPTTGLQKRSHRNPPVPDGRRRHAEDVELEPERLGRGWFKRRPRGLQHAVPQLSSPMSWAATP